MPFINDKPEGKKVGWDNLGTSRLFESPWFNLRQDHAKLPNGKEIDFTYIEQPGAVFIVPVTPAKKIILFRQYRYTVDTWCWEIVAGGLGDKKGKTLEEAAREEVMEELGGKMGRVEPLGTYSTANGITDIQTNFFIGYDTELVSEPAREATEIISEIKEFELSEAEHMAINGQISCSDDALGVILAIRKLKPL